MGAKPGFRDRAATAYWGGDPFALDQPAAYARWREARLAGAPTSVGEVVVEVTDPAEPTPAERAALAARLARANLAVYAAPPAPALSRDGLRALGACFGLRRLDTNMLADDDGISPLAVAPAGTRVRYIPYTDRPLAWHTDGYYNPPDRQVRAIVLHCVRPAADGGGNALLDHEIAYILLRDADPAHVAALMRDDAMYIPPNDEEGAPPRPGRPGPVFSVAADGRLHMRYTRRKTNITWSAAPDTQAAVAALEALLDSDCPFILRHRLEAGQGLICANVLHNRGRFSAPDPDPNPNPNPDSGPTPGVGRLIYRARYHDALAL